MNRIAIGSERHKSHPVTVFGKRFPGAELQIVGERKCNLSTSHSQPTSHSVSLDKGINRRGIDVLGCFPGKPKQYGLVRAVPDSGESQRAIKLHADFLGAPN